MGLVGAAWIEAELRARGDPDRRVKEAAYLKLDAEFSGTSVPVTRTIVKSWLKNNQVDRRQLLEVVDALWRNGLFECRMAAMMLLVERERLLHTDDLHVVERLVRDAHTWALSDDLSSHVAGPVVGRDPSGTAAVLDRWSTDDDFWIRQAALLSLRLPLRTGGGDFERFARYADTMLDEKEFFIRKAIGWVLREAGKKRPDLVEEFLRPRMSRVSGVSLREALKPLPPQVRDELVRLR